MIKIIAVNPLQKAKCGCKELDMDILKNKNMTLVNRALNHYGYNVDKLPIYLDTTKRALKDLSHNLNIEMSILISLLDYSILKDSPYKPKINGKEV